MEQNDEYREQASALLSQLGRAAERGLTSDHIKDLVVTALASAAASHTTKLEVQVVALRSFYEWCYRELSYPTRELRTETESRMRAVALALGELEQRFPGDANKGDSGRGYTASLKACREQCESAEHAEEGSRYKSHFTILAIENLARAVEQLRGEFTSHTHDGPEQ